jgi:hypothetical protein
MVISFSVEVGAVEPIQILTGAFGEEYPFVPST